LSDALDSVPTGVSHEAAPSEAGIVPAHLSSATSSKVPDGDHGSADHAPVIEPTEVMASEPAAVHISDDFVEITLSSSPSARVGPESGPEDQDSDVQVLAVEDLTAPHEPGAQQEDADAEDADDNGYF
jgi:hypothetical protein